MSRDVKPAPEPRCPHCGQPQRPTAPLPQKPVTRYVLESLFAVKRMNGGFV